MLIEVILSTTREDRFSARVGEWVAAALGARDGLETDVLDLRDHPLPFFDGSRRPSSPVSTRRPRSPGSASGWTAPTGS